MNKIQVSFWVCELLREGPEQDWSDPVDPGKEIIVNQVVARVICNESDTNICIGGCGNDGLYHQFDSEPAFYAGEYFAEKRHKTGLLFRMFRVQTDVDYPY